MALLAALTLTTTAAAAWGQGTPTDIPPPAPPPPPAAETPPPPPPPAPPAVATTPPPAPTPPVAADAMPATRPEVLPPIDVGAWVRASSIFQGTDPSKLDDWHMDAAYVELHAGGRVHKKVGVTLNLNANYAGSNPSAALEDAIIAFDFIDEFHLWAGHLLVPVDRSNASGPFFMIPWNYPGNFANPTGTAFAAAPKEGAYGRNNGAVVWGDIAGGKLTYLAGAFDNNDVTTSPLFSGRVRLALWDAEPGFWGNGSFFGDKNILSFGLGGQFQKHGSSTTDPTTMAVSDKDWAEVNVDGLMEKKLGSGSFVTLEAAYYHYNVNDGGINNAFYVLGAYATPTVGIGSIQPMVRYQLETFKSISGTNPWNIDVGLSYLIKGPALRVLATYSHVDLGVVAPTAGPGSTNSIQLSGQAIFF